jgi:hypothetical protein
MKALILGILITAASVFAAIPAGLNWWEDILAFLRGSLPVIAVFIGLIAVFIGITDIRDQAGSKKEDASASTSPH